MELPVTAACIFLMLNIWVSNCRIEILKIEKVHAIASCFASREGTDTTENPACHGVRTGADLDAQ